MTSEIIGSLGMEQVLTKEISEILCKLNELGKRTELFSDVRKALAPVFNNCGESGEAMSSREEIKLDIRAKAIESQRETTIPAEGLNSWGSSFLTGLPEEAGSLSQSKSSGSFSDKDQSKGDEGERLSPAKTAAIDGGYDLSKALKFNLSGSLKGVGVTSGLSDKAIESYHQMNEAIKSISLDISNIMIPSVSSLYQKISDLSGGLADFSQRYPAISDLIATTVSGTEILDSVFSSYDSMEETWSRVFKNVRASMLLAREGQEGLSRAQLDGTLVARGAAAAQKAYDAATAGFGVAKQAAATGLLKTKTIALSVAQKGASVAQWAFNVAFSANPIGLAVTAIAALIGIGTLLYQNWDLISEKFSVFGLAIKGKIIGFLEFVGTVPSKLMGFFSSIPEGVCEAFSGLPDILYTPFRKAFDKVFGLFKKVGNFWGKIKGKLMGDLEVNGVDSDIPIDCRSEGGIATSPKVSLWGENGKEYIIPVTPPNDGRGRRLWYMAGRDLGIIDDSNCGGSASAVRSDAVKDTSNPLIKSYDVVTNVIEAYDLSKLVYGGLKSISEKLMTFLGVGAASFLPALGQNEPSTLYKLIMSGFAFWATRNLSIALSDGLIGAVKIDPEVDKVNSKAHLDVSTWCPSVSQDDVSIDKSSDIVTAVTTVDNKVQSLNGVAKGDRSSSIYLTYSPNVTINSLDETQAIAGAVNLSLHDSMDNLIIKLRELQEQDRRVALE